MLTDPHVDPSAEGRGAQENGAVILASKHGRVAVVQLLLADPRVDPSAAANRQCVTAG